MPEVIFSGPAGRIEARYHHSKAAGSPIAILLHPHPSFGGTMNNPIVHAMYQMFQSRGFSVLRFNFRGVGRSQGIFENGAGELFFESRGEDNVRVWATVVNAQTGGAQRLIPDKSPVNLDGGAAYKKFNRYGLLWTEKAAKWYLNGREVFTLRRDFSKEPLNIHFFHHLPEGGVLREFPNPQLGPEPVQIEWVRAYVNK